MKSIINYINEKLFIKRKHYKYFPETKTELKKIIIDRIKKEGNNVNLNDIDTSDITNMEALFYSKFSNDFCGDVSEWDVSNVTNMHSMFNGCKKFNCDLSKWKVDNVTDMRGLFCDCQEFEGKGLDTWNVSNVTDMEATFCSCYKIVGKELETWDTKSVIDMTDMFYACKNLDCNLSKWNVKNVKDASDMFADGSGLQFKHKLQPKFTY